MTSLKQKMDEWERARKISESRGDDQEKIHPFLKDMDLFHDGLKEAVEYIKSQSRSEFDSGPRYVGEGAVLLKKWGVE